MTDTQKPARKTIPRLELLRLVGVLNQFTNTPIGIELDTTIKEGVVLKDIVAAVKNVAPKISEHQVKEFMRIQHVYFADDKPRVTPQRAKWQEQRLSALEKRVLDLEAKLAGMSKPSNSLSGIIDARPLPMPTELPRDLKMPLTSQPRPLHPWPNNKSKQ